MARARPHPARRDRRPRPRRWRLGLAGAVAATVGLTALGVAGASRRQPEPPPLADDIEGEIAGLIDAGVPPDDPKIRLLEEQVEELRRGSGVTPPREPGVDLGARVAEARAAERGRERARQWERGIVDCEPLPGLLSVEELADATCLSVPQPDGSGRYVAVGRGGRVRSVAFGADGQVSRAPDRQLPSGVTPGPGNLAATPAGHLRVTVPGKAPVTIDLE